MTNKKFACHILTYGVSYIFYLINYSVHDYLSLLQSKMTHVYRV